MLSFSSLASSLSRPFMPRGDCWLWDWRLVLLHAPTSLLTFLGLSLVALVALYIYHQGRLRELAISYPQLWRAGIITLTTTGASHLGNFLETWYGGGLYWLTGINKVFMAGATLWFAVHFWRHREDFVWIALIMDRVKEEQEKERSSSSTLSRGPG